MITFFFMSNSVEKYLQHGDDRIFLFGYFSAQDIDGSFSVLPETGQGEEIRRLILRFRRSFSVAGLHRFNKIKSGQQLKQHLRLFFVPDLDDDLLHINLPFAKAGAKNFPPLQLPGQAALGDVPAHLR
jgi:hypothetical protein